MLPALLLAVLGAGRVLLRRVDGSASTRYRYRSFDCGRRPRVHPRRQRERSVRRRLPGVQRLPQEERRDAAVVRPRNRPSGQPSERPTARPSGSAFRGGFGGGLGASSSPPAGVSADAWAKAQQACASVRPSFAPGQGRPGGAGGIDATALAAYVSCLKDHGVTVTGTGFDALRSLDRSDPTVAKAVTHMRATHADAWCSTVTERQLHRLSSDRRGEAYALRAGIDVHRRAADEPGEHQTGRPRDIDSQR